MAEGPRPSSRELLADLVGKPGNSGVVDIVRQLEAFVAPKRGDIGGLAIEVDRVLGVGLELRGDRCGQFAEAPARCARCRAIAISG